MTASPAKVVLISGANRGIGAVTARALSAAGWHVSLGMRQPDMPGWAQEDNTHLFAYDATDPHSADLWVEAARNRFGRIDAIIANAGIMIPKSVIEADDEDIDAMMTINVKAPRQLAKAAWNELARSGSGRVIIIGSLSGKRVKSAGAGSYALSKFAAVALAHALRQAGYDLGIRATALCPGFVATDMTRDNARAASDMTRPEDIARIIELLLSLPNEASVAEFTVNCQLEPSF